MSLLRSVIARSRSQKPQSQVSGGMVSMNASVSGRDKPAFSDLRESAPQTTDVSSAKPLSQPINTATTAQQVGDNLFNPTTSSSKELDHSVSSDANVEQSSDALTSKANTTTETTSLSLNNVDEQHIKQSNSERIIDTNDNMVQKIIPSTNIISPNKSHIEQQHDTLRQPSTPAKSVENIDVTEKFGKPSGNEDWLSNESEKPDNSDSLLSLKTDREENDVPQNNKPENFVSEKITESIKKFETITNAKTVEYQPKQKTPQKALSGNADVREKQLHQSDVLAEKSNSITREILNTQPVKATEKLVQTVLIKNTDTGADTDTKQTIPSLPSQPATTMRNNQNLNAQPTQKVSAKNQAVPRVQIGQIDVIIQAPQPVSKQPASSRNLSDLASRMYLRRL